MTRPCWRWTSSTSLCLGKPLLADTSWWLISRLESRRIQPSTTLICTRCFASAFVGTSARLPSSVRKPSSTPKYVADWLSSYVEASSLLTMASLTWPDFIRCSDPSNCGSILCLLTTHWTNALVDMDSKFSPWSDLVRLRTMMRSSSTYRAAEAMLQSLDQSSTNTMRSTSPAPGTFTNSSQPRWKQTPSQQIYGAGHT